MQRVAKTLFAAVLAALSPALPAHAQQPGFPQFMPPNTVYGRSGISTGPGQAIPFSTIIQTLSSQVNIWSALQTFSGGVVMVGNAANFQANLPASGQPAFTIVGTGSSPVPAFGINPGNSAFPCSGFYSFCGSNGLGYQAFLGYSASSLLVSPVGFPQSTAGAYFIGENDYVGAAGPSVYGTYTECRAGNNLFCAGIEADAETTTATAADNPTPLSIFGASSGPFSVAVWISNGGTKVPFAAHNSSCAICVFGNGSATTFFNKGLVFPQGSIAQISSHNEAIDLYTGYEIAWYAAGPLINRLSGDGTNLISSGPLSVAVGGAPSGLFQVGNFANTSADFAYFAFNGNTFFPATGKGLAISVNAGGGGTEVDFYNTITASTKAFNFYQQTGASAVTLIATMSSAGGLNIGTTGTDPGAKNLRVEGTIINPGAATGTPAASLCLDSSNNIIKKTTTGPCV